MDSKMEDEIRLSGYGANRPIVVHFFFLSFIFEEI